MRERAGKREDDVKSNCVLKNYENIPAYKKFVAEQGIDPADVKSVNDIPVVDKRNYMEKYPLEKQIRPEAELGLFALSGGTSGGYLSV